MDGRRTVRLSRMWAGPARIRRCEPRPLPRSWAWAVSLAWPLLFIVSSAIAPAPSDPNAVPTLLDSLVFTAFIVGLVGTTAAAFTGRATALAWSIGLGVLWMGTAIACPASGHHTVADWQWRLELTLSAGILFLSALGWRRLHTH